MATGTSGPVRRAFFSSTRLLPFNPAKPVDVGAPIGVQLEAMGGGMPQVRRAVAVSQVLARRHGSLHLQVTFLSGNRLARSTGMSEP